MFSYWKNVCHLDIEKQKDRSKRDEYCKGVQIVQNFSESMAKSIRRKQFFVLSTFARVEKNSLQCARTQMHCYGNLKERKSETNTSFSLDCLLTSRDIGLQLSGIPLVRKGFDIITSGSDNKKFETCPFCTNNQFIALAVSSCIPLRTQFSISE